MHEPDLAEQQLLLDTRAKLRASLDAAERRAEYVVGGVAVVAIALLWLLPPSGGWSPVAALVCAAGMVAAATVRFDVGGGYTVPAQVAFIPLLFTVPAQALPLVVVAVLALGRLPAVVRGEQAATRLAVSFGNSWFAIGAALYLGAIGGSGAVARSPELAVGLVVAQFVADFLAAAVREAMIRGASLRQQLGEAAWVYGIDAALTPAPLFIVVAGGQPIVAIAVLLPIVALLASFAVERRKRLESMFELNSAYHGTALLLGDVVEADDGYTGEHCRSVVQLALDVGREMALSREQMRNLEFGALLHDIGKIAVPKEIINKPGKLDDREWAIIKTHTTEGQRMLDRVGGFMRDVGMIVRSHHERWDGGGYPDGLAGDAIPLESRIVSACDSFNAMTTTRSYRRAMPLEAAVRELRDCSGAQFDPTVVDTLINVVAPDDSTLALMTIPASLAPATVPLP